MSVRVAPAAHSMEYIQKGTNPTLLILSGMHGDEYEVIDFVSAYIQANKNSLPDFLYIPQVSPSAVAQKTRHNVQGHDVNRGFVEPVTDSEILLFMNNVKNYKFDVCIDFHEDPDRTRGCYVYDTDTFSHTDLTKLRSAIVSSGASLYTGVDDPVDAHLGWHVRDGYISMPFSRLPQGAGFSGRWLLEQGIVKRSFTVEVPGQAYPVIKKKLVKALLDSLVQLTLYSRDAET